MGAAQAFATNGGFTCPPRVWRGPGHLRFRPRHLSENRSGAAGQRRHEQSRVHLAEQKQVFRLDGCDHRHIDGAETLANGEDEGTQGFRQETCRALEAGRSKARLRRLVVRAWE